MEMASLKSPEESDRSSYINYSAKVHQERILLDQKDTLEGELKFLHQTLSYLVLHSPTTTSSNPAIQAVTNVIKTKNGKLNDLVSFDRCT